MRRQPIRKQVVAAFSAARTREEARCPFCGALVAAEYPRDGSRGFLSTVQDCPHLRWWPAGAQGATIAEFVGTAGELDAQQEAL